MAVLRSPETLAAVGWRGEWEFQGAEGALRRLGVPFVTLTPARLEAGQWQGRLLVLPDVRLMSEATAAAVRRHVQGGGRILATYQTSYRDEKNQPMKPAAFRLGDLFGVDFHRWAGSSPTGVAMRMGDRTVALGRGEAMLVRARPGSTVLAEWVGPEPSPALVEAPAGVYAGANLFAPENSDSPQVTRLLGSLLERLLPGFRTPAAPVPASPLAPKLPFVEIPAQGREVSVGLAPLDADAVVSAAQGVCWPGGQARRVRVRRIATVGRPPAVAIYDERGRLLVRSEQPLRLQGAPWLEVLRLNPNGTYRWAAYRGDVRLDPGAERVGLVNVLPLEPYLAGVVPNEMPPWFPPQALRAMGVVARTFTLSHLGRHQGEGFDLCATVHCHVYEGLASEHPSSSEAVRETLDQVLLWDGRPADTTYHAVCGGEGDSPAAVWPGSPPEPYLPGRPDTADAAPRDLSREADLRAFLDTPQDAFCDTAGRFRWEETWTLPDLSRKVAESLPRLLGKDAPLVGDLRRVEVTGRMPHGRVATLLLEGDLGRAEVRGDAVRWLTSGGRIGAGGLQSTLFYVDLAEGKVRIRGGGWGHGVGLCQEGAAGRARAGQDYRAILEHYYPGTRQGGDQPRRTEPG